MNDDDVQRFLAKILEIAEEDEIPCIAWKEEENETIVGLMIGESEFIEYLAEELPMDKSKKVH